MLWTTKTTITSLSFIVLSIFVTSQLISRPSFRKSSAQSAPTTHQIIFDGVSLNPANLSILKNDIVTWVNTSQSTYVQIASDPHPIHTDHPFINEVELIAPGNNASLIFPKLGTFGYHNHLNDNIRGTISVNESPTPTNIPTNTPVPATNTPIPTPTSTNTPFPTNTNTPTPTQKPIGGMIIPSATPFNIAMSPTPLPTISENPYFVINENNRTVQSINKNSPVPTQKVIETEPEERSVLSAVYAAGLLTLLTVIVLFLLYQRGV